MVEIEDPVLREDEPREELEVNLNPASDVIAEFEDPELKDDTDEEEPLLVLDVPVAKEIDDPRLSVFFMPEWKQPAQRGPSPLGLVMPVFITTISALTSSIEEVSTTS